MPSFFGWDFTELTIGRCWLAIDDRVFAAPLADQTFCILKRNVLTRYKNKRYYCSKQHTKGE